jgi:hypothetical protein
MKTLFTALLLQFIFVCSAFAGPTCTDKAKDKWQDQEKFKKNLIEQGYKIKVFKVTSGNCYEIYGWNKNKKKVEIYFNPITAAVVKKRMY